VQDGLLSICFDRPFLALGMVKGARYPQGGASVTGEVSSSDTSALHSVTCVLSKVRVNCLSESSLMITHKPLAMLLAICRNRCQ
jgi:hypothetical protein